MPGSLGWINDQRKLCALVFIMVTEANCSLR
jgi:hypothetical protein